MEKNRMRPVASGRNMRMSYSRQREVLELPNLIEIQKKSYEWFLSEGLREAFDDISPISDFSGNLSLEFVDFKFCTDEAKYTIQECKERDATYAAPLKVKVNLVNHETGTIREHTIFMGDMPLMTETGSFVINGAERVIVSQLVRSPGIYYSLKGAICPLIANWACMVSVMPEKRRVIIDFFIVSVSYLMMAILHTVPFLLSLVAVTTI